MSLKKIFSNKYFYLIAGVLLFIISNGNWIVPAASWIAPVFILRYFRSQKVLPGLLTGIIIFTIAARIMLYDIIPNFIGMMTYTLTVYWAMTWFIPYFIDRIFYKKIPGFPATLIFPAAVVVTEYFSNLYVGTWASIAYTQYQNLPLLQVMSITGLWGVSFLVTWFASVFVWILDNNFSWEKVRHGVKIYGFVLAAVLFYGGLRLAFDPVDSATVKIGSITSSEAYENYSGVKVKENFSNLRELADKNINRARAVADSVYSLCFNTTMEAVKSGAKIVVWPEGAVSVLKEYESGFLKRCSLLADEENIYMLVGYYVYPDNWPENYGEQKMTLIDKEGNTHWKYLKSHIVPGNPNIKGDGIVPVLDTEYGRLGGVICYDMDFPHFIRQAGQKGVDIMLVPSWDWKAIDPLHTIMASFRTIENGFSLVRQAADGLSIAMDNQGRTIASMDHFRTEEKIMISHVPVKGRKTVYSCIGDLFAWLCIAFIAGVIVYGFRRKKGQDALRIEQKK